MSKQSGKEEKYQLPIKVIKKDLAKTFLFMAFVFAFLLILHYGDVSYNDIFGFVQSVFKN